jgi:hypothetical protein
MFDAAGPNDLVAKIESTHRQESVLVARRMAAVAALLRHRVAAAERAEHRRGYAVIEPTLIDNLNVFVANSV